MKVSELEGEFLDYWVAKAEGIELLSTMPPRIVGSYDRHQCDFTYYSPSTDWAYGGPIIERENIQISPPTSAVHINGGPNAGWRQSGRWSSTIWKKGPDDKRHVCYHETSPLIAAMRCYVATKYGDEVPNVGEL